MNTYYIGGFRITDELYHHGIKDQKWGVRRYQYSDGTLTPEGKERYYKSKASSSNHKILSSAAKSVKKVTKRYVGHVKLNIKKRYPWMLNDEELSKVIDRMSMEKKLRDLRKDEKASKFINRTLKNVEDTSASNIREFGKSFSNASGKCIAERLFKKEKNKEKKEKKDNKPKKQ